MPDMTIDDITSGGGKLPPELGTPRQPRQPKPKIPRVRKSAPVIAANVPEPPARRRAAPPAIAAVAAPPPRRRRPVNDDIQEAEHVAQPTAVAGRFTLPGFHRPLPLYWQHHGAPDYVQRHAEEMVAYKKALLDGDDGRIEKMSDQMIVNIYMYEDALRRFFPGQEHLTDEQFARLEYDMIGAFDNCKPGCHQSIIDIDGKDVFMKWVGGAGDIVRDSLNAIVFFKLLEKPH